MNSVIAENREWIEKVWKKTDNKLRRVCVRSREKLPYTSEDGIHDDMCKKDIAWWTNGFWGGMMWLMYNATGVDDYKITAERSEELLDNAFDDFFGLHHDVGFMWHLTAGANYRLTGSKQAFKRNILAAGLLASRYNVDGKFIRAWNSEGSEGWTIIDCMMNIPLLYWASDEVGDERFKRIAMHHADMTMRDHIRADGSVNHIVEHNTETGEMVRVYAGQGVSETSCWSRGLAWAVYGSILSYIHTGKEEYREAAIKTANYFIVNCAETGYLPLVDFRAPEEPVLYDSTAGACAACGMLELAKYVSDAEAKMYTKNAVKILKAIDERCCDYSEDTDSLVGMGTEFYPKKGETKGIHIPIIYGDFFFVEAMLKLKGSEFLIW